MFEEILKSKTHNSHYLNRYIKFINHFILYPSNEDYLETHHICPKAKDMFPEYSNLSKHKWNAIKLTFRQHIIAHYLLLKSYSNLSQSLSVVLTSGQHHVSTKFNSRLISISKRILSENRKGIFTRGYNQDGSPNVSKHTKEKLSELKKQFYSNPENRLKQSISCKGSTGRNTEKYKSAAANRSQEHLQKIKNSIKEHYSNKSSFDKKKMKNGIYVTPIGNFTSSPFFRYCIDSDKVITIHSCKSKDALFTKDVIGMTPRELGFCFIPKNDPELQQYYDGLNLAHLPEPSHPLASKLNDYLSREKLLP
jgi:hypothetical protein